jgi:hypothetical protein
MFLKEVERGKTIGKINFAGNFLPKIRNATVVEK